LFFPGHTGQNKFQWSSCANFDELTVCMGAGLLAALLHSESVLVRIMLSAMRFENLLNNSQKVRSENLLDVTMTDIWQVERSAQAIPGKDRLPLISSPAQELMILRLGLGFIGNK